jgi:site-specific recombinase XerD
MRVSFYLDRPTAPQSVVMLNVAFRSKRFRFSTGISTDPKQWNDDRQEPKSNDPHQNINRRRLNSIREAIDRAYHELSFSDKAKLISDSEVEAFKTRIETFLIADKPKQRDASFLEQFQEFIDTYTIRSPEGLVTTKRPSDVTLARYRTTLESLKAWSKAKRVTLDYTKIDETFYQHYCDWLRTAKGLFDATVANYIKTIKTFMKWARRKGYHQTTAYEEFYRDNRNSESIALTLDELQTIRNLDLTDSLRLSRTRDHFLLQVYTGMRYGDLKLLQPHHFDIQSGVIRYSTQKNDTRCIIPITRPMKEIIKKYPSLLFEFSSSVKQNLYLKELAQRANMAQQTTIIRFSAGKRVEEIKSRAELLTTHVARRTFASLSVRFGVPEAVIASVTGHSPKGILQSHYIRLDEQSICELVCNAWERL